MIGSIRRAFGREPRVPALFFVRRHDNPNVYLTLDGDGFIALALFSTEDRAQMYLITNGLDPDEWTRGEWLGPRDVQRTTEWAMRTSDAYSHIVMDPAVKWGEQTHVAPVAHVNRFARDLVKSGARAVVVDQQ